MKNLLTLFTAALLLFVASCEEVDGKWPAMKWKVDGKKMKTCEVVFDAGGGQAVCECTNYSGVWFSEMDAYDFESFNGVWFVAEVSDNKVIIKCESTEDDKCLPRESFVGVTAGDIFGSIKITQR